MHSIEIRRAWDGTDGAPGEAVRLEILAGSDVWEVRVDAPDHGDPPPPAPPGRLDGLWEFEVVELFLVGADGR